MFWKAGNKWENCHACAGLHSSFKLLFISQCYSHILFPLAILIERPGEYGFPKWLCVRFDRGKSHTPFIMKTTLIVSAQAEAAKIKQTPSSSPCLHLALNISSSFRKITAFTFRSQLHLLAKRFPTERL